MSNWKSRQKNKIVSLALGLLAWTTPLAAKPSLPWLLDLIGDRAETVSDTLALIEKKEPRLLENHVIIYDTMSTQSSSPQCPRVLLFSEDGTFVVTFSEFPDGGPKGHGRDRALEIMQHTKEDGFSFHEIVFDKTPEQALVGRLWNSVLGSPLPVPKLKFTKGYTVATPQECWGCHQGRAATFPLKPAYQAGLRMGFYGGYQNEILSGSTESEDFIDFVEAAPNRFSYRFLKGLPKKDSILSQSRLHRSYRVHESQGPAPADRLGLRLETLHYGRIEKLLKDHPFIERLKYAVGGALLDCSHFESFIRSPAWVSEKLGAIETRVRRKMRDYFEVKYEMFLDYNPFIPVNVASLKEAGRVSKLIYSLEGLPKVRFFVDDWTLTQNVDSFEFGDSQGGMLQRFYPYYKQAFLPKGEVSCQSLQIASAEATLAPPDLNDPRYFKHLESLQR